MSTEKYLTISEVSHLLNISPSLVYSLCNRRELPCIRFGRAIRIPNTQLQRYLQRKLTPLQSNAIERWLSHEEAA